MYPVPPKYKQDDLVTFDMNPIKGVGRVCGIAHVGVPILGVGYILEIVSIETPLTDYPFTHFQLFESFITGTAPQ